MTCVKGPHLEPLNDAPVVPGEVHHGVPSDFSVTKPMSSVLHYQLGPSKQRLDLALKVCWDCNPTIPCCKRGKRFVSDRLINKYTKGQFALADKFCNNW